MGGNALKTVQTRRIEAAEYHELVKELQGILSPHFKNVVPIPAYRNKPDFGDADILVDVDNTPGDLSALLQDLLHPQEIAPNGECTSLDYKGVQVDIIRSHTRVLPIHLVFYSYNDLGTLIGKTATGFGLKLGHKGLFKAINTNKGTTHLGQVELSVDPKEIFTFLDYDYERYQKGFTDRTEIFEYAASTKYFNATIFREENLRHEDRTRERKRPVYRDYRAWVETQTNLPNYPFEPVSSYLPMLDAAFPNAKLLETRAKLIAEFDRKVASQAKLREAIAPLNLTGKPLGDAIQAFKAKHEDWMTQVEQATLEEIQADCRPTMELE